ncbi:MAG: hypothetical protein AMXMBFR58_07630 [Phycisphaerae bacterium]
MSGTSDSADIASSLYEQLSQLRHQLKKRYPLATKQVAAKELRTALREASEVWLANLAVREDVKLAINEDVFAAMAIDFESLHQATAHASLRRIYDHLLKSILGRFQLDVVVAIKRSVATPPRQSPPTLIRPTATIPTVFVGHSFLSEDAQVCDSVVGLLRAVGFQVFTGEKPKANRISDKVKELIDSQDVFVGVFTRRDKIAKKNEWTTTMWVVEEKTWAMAKNKRLVLMREHGVKNLGGMHADHEYIDFDRNAIGPSLVKLIEHFIVEPIGLR